jgi:hypothetical protein
MALAICLAARLTVGTAEPGDGLAAAGRPLRCAGHRTLEVFDVVGRRGALVSRHSGRSGVADGGVPPPVEVPRNTLTVRGVPR